MILTKTCEHLSITANKLITTSTQVIEYVLGVNRHGPLQSSTVQQFVESVGSRTSTPGGGSVSALVTALGLALGTYMLVGFRCVIYHALSTCVIYHAFCIQYRT